MPDQILNIRVIPNAKATGIVLRDGNKLKIRLTAPAHEGKANQALIKFLSGYLGIAKNKIKIISGEKSKDKKVQIG